MTNLYQPLTNLIGQPLSLDISNAVQLSNYIYLYKVFFYMHCITYIHPYIFIGLIENSKKVGFSWTVGQSHERRGVQAVQLVGHGQLNTKKVGQI